MAKRNSKTDAVRKKLSPAEERFCVLYSCDAEFFANGTQSYIEAFEPDRTAKGWYDRAKSAAYHLLTKSHILRRINELLELRGLNDPFVDKQLELLVTQNADFRSKVQAIKEYNRLKNRVVERVDHTTKGEKIAISWSD